jgi:ABC-type hemin transport system ATPase subunit
MVLSVEALVFGYAGRGLLLHHVSFTVGEGEILCLLGPNGAGKTTLLRCILGMQRVQGGRITIAGREVRTLTARELATQAASVPQAAGLSSPFSVAEMVLMGRTPYIHPLAVRRVPTMTLHSRLWTRSASTICLTPVYRDQRWRTATDAHRPGPGPAGAPAAARRATTSLD